MRRGKGGSRAVTAVILMALAVAGPVSCGGSDGAAADPDGAILQEWHSADLGATDTNSKTEGVRDGGLDLVPFDIPWRNDHIEFVEDIFGQMNTPCQQPEDCDSGMCIDTGAGSVCTIICIEDCPEGWVCKGLNLFGSDPTFVCVPQYLNICKPCDTADVCGTPESVCLQFDGDPQASCSVSCQSDGDCPGGYTCRADDGVCVPPTGTCSCLPEAAGTVRDCQVENEHGSCDGTQTCSDEGWSSCDAVTPAVDICDGLDNDCDGDIDEGYPLKDGPCDGDDSDLCANGTWTCTADGSGLECVNETVTDIPELCDGIDNDCDGDKDEDFPDKGLPCDGEDGDLCKNGTWTCSADGSKLECVNETQTNIVEICDDWDNDCDGLIDEDYPLKGQPCDTDDSDFCMNGQWTCNAEGSSVECVSETITDIVEICDYKDNDCDGVIDEGFDDLGQPCDGPDSDLCANGTLTCKQDGSGTECVNENPVNLKESCDGQDNDCDGQVDPENSLGCTVYYKDQDLDGLGDASVPGKCLCAPSGNFKVTVATDCYDSNAQAKPGQTGWFTSHRGDGSFDYDCNGGNDKHWTQVASSCTLSLEVCSGTEGWSGNPPNCGIQGTWRTNCHWVFDPFGGKVGCYFDDSKRTQECH